MKLIIVFNKDIIFEAISRIYEPAIFSVEIYRKLIQTARKGLPMLGLHIRCIPKLGSPHNIIFHNTRLYINKSFIIVFYKFRKNISKLRRMYTNIYYAKLMA